MTKESIHRVIEGVWRIESARIIGALEGAGDVGREHLCVEQLDVGLDRLHVARIDLGLGQPALCGFKA